MTGGSVGVFAGHGAKKGPGLKPLDSKRLIQGAEAPCSLRRTGKSKEQATAMAGVWREKGVEG